MTTAKPSGFKESYVASVSAIWAPLYGKVNIVSELALNLQVYGIAGAGIHGLRKPVVIRDQASLEGFVVDYENFNAACDLGGGLETTSSMNYRQRRSSVWTSSISPWDDSN